MLIKHNKYYNVITLLDSLITELRDACAQGYSRAFTKFACLQRPAMLTNFLTLGPWRKRRDSHPRTGISRLLFSRQAQSARLCHSSKCKGKCIETPAKEKYKKNAIPQPRRRLKCRGSPVRLLKIRIKEKEMIHLYHSMAV